MVVGVYLSTMLQCLKWDVFIHLNIITIIALLHWAAPWYFCDLPYITCLVFISKHSIVNKLFLPWSLQPCICLHYYSCRLLTALFTSHVIDIVVENRQWKLKNIKRSFTKYSMCFSNLFTTLDERLVISVYNICDVTEANSWIQNYNFHTKGLGFCLHL